MRLDKIIITHLKMLMILFGLAGIILRVSSKFDLQCERDNTNYNATPTIFLTERQKLVPTKYNFSMIVDARDYYVSRFIAETGVWEHKALVPIVSMLNEGDTFLNLGTQSGIQAILIGKLIGKEGRMYLFQPYSASYKIMKKNIFINSLEEQTETYNLAAGDKRETATIVVEFGNTGASNVITNNSSILYTGASKKYGSELQVVNVDRVDDVLPGVIIDFAMIDVQRMEVQALLGMQQLLQRSPAAILAVEWQFKQNPRKNQQKLKRLIQMMIRLRRRAYKYIPDSDVCKMGRFVDVGLLYAELAAIKQQEIYFTPQNISLN